MLEHFFKHFCPLLMFIFKIDFFQKSSFENSIRAPNSLDQDQDRHLVCPDLGPNYLQRLSAIDTNRQRVRYNMNHIIALSA